MQDIRDAILSGDRTQETYAGLPIPESYRAVDGAQGRGGPVRGHGQPGQGPPQVAARRRRAGARARPPARPSSPSWPARSTTTPCGPRSSSRCRPSGSSSATAAPRSYAKRHDLPYHVVGSDLAGVVLRTGPGVQKWKPGNEVVAHCLSVELESADGHNDTMLDPEQRIWGFETNFGGLAELAIVKTNQLMPKPDHLTWEEAASPGLVNSTAYRQLISRNGAGMKLGDTVLIWGASGGLGSYATQMALAGGATPVCVVSSPDKADICRAMGAELVIDRNAEGYRFWKDEHDAGPEGVEALRRAHPRAHRRQGRRHRLRAPRPRDLRRSTYVARKGGTIVTCASTSGYMHEYDNRYLWMNLKRIIGSPLRQLPRGVGGQRPDQPGPDPPDPVQDVRAWTRWARRHTTSTRTSTRARSACSRLAPEERPRACRTPRSAPSTRPRSTGSATPDLRR